MRKLKKEIGLIARGMALIHEVCQGLLGIVLFRELFTSLSPFINIYMSAKIVDSIGGGAGLRELYILVGITITANLLVHLAKNVLGYLVNNMRYRFWAKCEMLLGSRMMDMDYADVESARTHQLRQRIQDYRNFGLGLENLLYQFQALAGNAFTVVYSVSLSAALFTASYEGEASGILAFVVSPAASAALALAILLNAFISMRFSGSMAKKAQEILNGAASANRIYNYYLENHILNYHPGKDVRIYRQKEALEEETMEQIEVGNQVAGKEFRNQAGYSGGAAFFTVLLSAFVYLFGGLRAMAGMIGVGELVMYIGSVSRFTEGFTGFVTALAMLFANNEAMKVYFEFLDIPARMTVGGREVSAGIRKAGGREVPAGIRKAGGWEVPAGIRKAGGREVPAGIRKAGGREVPAGIRKSQRGGEGHEIEFRNVSFRYPDTEVWALRNVSFRLGTGKRLAVVGMNGSGKSTFIKLLCRLYDPVEGSILLDGVDIREYDIAAYRDIFSVVFQDFKLFSFPLAQNVAAQEEADAGRVEDCLRRAGLGERLSGLPDGIDTCLYKDFEKGGVEVSGGEAQKIALARALYKDAPFVILDEPAAALDPVAEYEMYSRFDEIVGGKTAIYISHRLSSCRFCDEIAVFHMGSLVQRGTHEELVAKEGKYHELWHAQAQHYSSAERMS